jgi:hypothetical protein
VKIQKRSTKIMRLIFAGVFSLELVTSAGDSFETNDYESTKIN